MPYRRYGRRTRRRKRSASSRKRSYFRHRGSRSQAGQLARIDKRLSGLTKTVSLNRSWFNFYNYTPSLNCPNHVDATNTYGYSVIPVLDPASGAFTPCFDLPTRADTDIDQWTYHGSKVHLRLDISTENTNPIACTTYVVSIRPTFQATAVANWGNKLQNFFLPALPDTTTPTDTQPNPIMCFSTGQTFINQRVFKIHSVKHTTLGEVGYGSEGVPVRNIGDTVQDYYFKIKKRVKLRRSQHDIFQALEDTNGALNRNAQTYIIIVTNNSAFDGGFVNATSTILHTFSAQS